MPSLSDLIGRDYGMRLAGAPRDIRPKQNGYFGMLNRPDGDMSTELSFGFNSGGKDILAPLLVPGLSLAEIQHLLSGARPTQEIYDKASQFAIERMRAGKPTFARPNEVYPLPGAQ